MTKLSFEPAVFGMVGGIFVVGCSKNVMNCDHFKMKPIRGEERETTQIFQPLNSMKLQTSGVIIAWKHSAKSFFELFGGAFPIEIA